MKIRNKHILGVLVVFEVLTILSDIFFDMFLGAQQYLAILLVIALCFIYVFRQNIFLYSLVVSLFVSMFGMFLFTPFNLVLSVGNVNIEILNVIIFLVVLMSNKLELKRLIKR